MALQGLRCKECGTQYPLEALYVCDQCFGPLEVAYDFSDYNADELKRKIQAGSNGNLALRRLPPVRGTARQQPGARPDPADPR